MNDEINIIELNSRFDEFLQNRRSLNKDLTFTYRKSNYGGRLDEGYWFYGNEYYLAISFWSGMDWKNRTPNIIFCVRNNGDIWLEINVSDSDRKRLFVTQFIIQQLGFEEEGRRYKKLIQRNCDLNSSIDELNGFLQGLKLDIDRIIKNEGDKFFLENENSIGFIDKKEFNSRFKKIKRYQEKQEEDVEEVRSNHLKPYKIKSYQLWDFGPINHLTIGDVPENNQWMFITGENGSGKTSLLKSIGTTLGYRAIEKEKIEKHPDFKCEIELYSSYHDQTELFVREKNSGISNRRPKTIGLCMYGPYRLMNSHKLKLNKYKSLYSKSGSFQSLFSDVAPLIDLEKQFEIWRSTRKTAETFNKRKYFIQSILIDIVPGLYDIRFDYEDGSNKKSTRYVTRKRELGDENGVKWEELSSGTKSVFSLIVDIMLRLYDQQPKIIDPSELQGIVLIDEIDLHLHPKAQKELIINLSKAFPEVQFIVTTHSPIPLLGAPKNSRIYVMKEIEDQIQIIRMDDKVMFSKILPNALLSSPIFELEDLTPVSKTKDEIAYLEEDYNRVVFLEKLEKEVNDYLTNSRQKELLEIFTKKG